MAFRAPKTELERGIADVLRSVLGVERIGADDNFFDLGGTSERLAEVHARLQAVLGREIQPVEIFNNPTVATLAAYFGGGAEEAAVRPILNRTDELKSGRNRLKQRLRRSGARRRRDRRPT